MRFKHKTWPFRIVVLMALLVAASSLAYAQGGTTASVSGTVVDSSGGVIPGAEVTLKHNGTGAVNSTATTTNGTFSIPGIGPGSYTLTVALMGFKTHVVPDVPVNAGVPVAVRITLEIGNLEETVVVVGGAEIVQTAASAVTTTLNVKQITSLPLSSRDLTNFVGSMPGVDVASSVRNANVNGLPQGQINITIDGVNVQDNTLKSSDGFFSNISPRLDAMEEMTFSSAAQGSDASAQGAVQMRFTTRSGSNKYVGSAYYYFQNDALNSNTYFNKRDKLPKADLMLYQPGGRLGGPIRRDKLFFFFNYEEYRQPSQITTNSTLLTPRAQQGWFDWIDKNGNKQSLNVYDEARKLNLPGATPDPLIGQLLNDIRNSTTSGGTLTDLTDPLYQRYSFQQPVTYHNRYPTVRIDYNLTANHRLSASTNSSTNSSFPDTTNGYYATFPGFPLINGQGSTRYQYQFSARSTLGKSLVNEARFGGSGSNIEFYKEYTKDVLTGSLANQGGFTLGLSAAGVTNAGFVPLPQARNAPNKTFEDNLTWIRRTHSMSFGGSFTQFDYWGWMQTRAPAISFGLVQGDPAQTALFSGQLTGNDLSKAQGLFAVLTGRVSAINGNVRLDENTLKYSYLGKGMSRAQLRQMDFFAQDSWRMRPNLTVNFGARYNLQLPFTSLNSSYSTATMADVWGITGVAPGFVPSTVGAGPNLGYLYQPGVLNGTTAGRQCASASPCYTELSKGTPMFATDWNNLAPSLGFNWLPSAKSGLLHRILGQSGDSSISGGYSVAYQRPGLSDFTGVAGANPGVSITMNRNYSNGNLADPAGTPGTVPATGSLPLLLSQTNRLGQPTIPETRNYPMAATISNSVNIFDPHLRVPYAATYTVGFQRAVSKNMSFSVRYVGTRNRDGWTAYNYNDTNIIENGFLNEFKAAQANLQYNIANGKGTTFAYTGPGTTPLPIYLAFFTGQPASAATIPENYNKSSNFRNSNYYNYLALTNPNPFSAAGTGSSGLGNTTFKANGIKAGLAPNFWVPNPDVSSANVTGNGGYTKYNSLQMELRRRLADGLQFNASYVFGRSYGSSRYSFRVDRLPTRQTGTTGGIEHAFKANWIYELPIGQGKPLLGNIGKGLDRFLGGWQVQGLARVQSGRLVDFGNVRLVGMTKQDLQDMYKVRVDSEGRVWMLPQDVIDNTVKAYNWSATDASGYSKGEPQGRYIARAQGPDCIESISTSYGECGTRSLVITSPMYWNVDMSFAKRVPIRKSLVFDFRAEMFNIFGATIFTPLTGLSTDPDDFEVTGTQISARTMQLVWRISW